MAVLPIAAFAVAAVSDYHRGPWPANPECPKRFLFDPPKHQRGTPPGQCGRSNTCSEYAYFNKSITAGECATTCCNDWSCWGFTFYPLGRIGNNMEPEGPGHSCDGTTPCCVLLNDMHDPVVKASAIFSWGNWDFCLQNLQFLRSSGPSCVCRPSLIRFPVVWHCVTQEVFCEA
jgi:hypothetical protein